MRNILSITESELHRIIKESVDEILYNGNGQQFNGFVVADDVPSKLYHSSVWLNRDSIYENGLIPSNEYSEWWGYPEGNSDDYMNIDWDEYNNLPKMIFLSTQSNIYRGWDGNMDIWEVDTSNLDKNKFFIDPSDDMSGCYCYHGRIPSEYVKLLKGSKGSEIPQMPTKETIESLKKYDRNKDNMNESKNDNLHQFVNYIASYGKPGTLRSKYNYSDFNKLGNDLDVGYDAYEILRHELDEYCDENEIDDPDEIENEFYTNRIKEEFNNLIDQLEINNNGLVYVERNIKISKNDKNNRVFRELCENYDGHLGIYWSYAFGQVIAGWKGSEISFKGWVRPEDINWSITVSNNIIYGDEYEINIDYDTDIEIDKISVVGKKGEHIIWNKPIILKT